MGRLMCRSNVEAMIVELQRHGRVFSFFTQPDLDGEPFESSDPVHVAQPDLILHYIIAECFPAAPTP